MPHFTDNYWNQLKHMTVIINNIKHTVLRLVSEERLWKENKRIKPQQNSDSTPILSWEKWIFSAPKHREEGKKRRKPFSIAESREDCSCGERKSLQSHRPLISLMGSQLGFFSEWIEEPSNRFCGWWSESSLSDDSPNTASRSVFCFSSIFWVFAVASRRPFGVSIWAWLSFWGGPQV